jgi:hypothetical protein
LIWIEFIFLCIVWFLKMKSKQIFWNIFQRRHSSLINKSTINWLLGIEWCWFTDLREQVSLLYSSLLCFISFHCLSLHSYLLCFTSFHSYSVHSINFILSIASHSYHFFEMKEKRVCVRHSHTNWPFDSLIGIICPLLTLNTDTHTRMSIQFNFTLIHNSKLWRNRWRSKLQSAKQMMIWFECRYSNCQLIEINAHSLFSKWFSESGKLVLKMFEKIKEFVEDETSFVCVLIGRFHFTIQNEIITCF